VNTHESTADILARQKLIKNQKGDMKNFEQMKINWI